MGLGLDGNEKKRKEKKRKEKKRREEKRKEEKRKVTFQTWVCGGM